jgi:MFS family permease
MSPVSRSSESSALVTDAGGHSGVRLMVKWMSLGFLPSVVTSLISPFLTVYLVQDRGYSVTQAAGLVGATTLLNSLLVLASGHIVDRVDRNAAARAGLLLIFSLPLALLFVPALPVLFFAILLFGFGYTLFDHAASANIYALPSKDVAKVAYSYYYAAQNCGTMLSPLVVFFLANGGYSSIFVVGLVLHAIVAVWYFSSFRSVGMKAAAEHRPFNLKSRFSFPLPLLFSFGFCYSLTYSQFFTTLPLALGDVRVLDRQIYPLLVSLNGLFVVLFQQIYVTAARRLNSQQCLLGGTLALASGYLLLLGQSNHVYTLLVYVALFTLAEVFINLSVTDVVFRRAPDGQQTSWLSIYQTSRLSGGLGTAAGGAMLASYGPAALYGAFLATVLPMIAISVLLLFHQRQTLTAAEVQTPATPDLR